MKRALVMVILVGSAFFGGSVALTVSSRWGSLVSAQPSDGLPPLSTDLLRLSDRFEVIARRVSPAVVYLEAVKPASASNVAAGKGKQVEESGSGVIIQIDGQSGWFVLTNNHVIAQARPEQITITAADGRLFHPSRVWADPESDVAVLRLEGVNYLTAAPVGDSERVRVGQWVLAIGSPFGLNQTVTHGIVSARERGQISLGSTIRIKDFLQTDAAINPGSSGGPLVNLEGEVIGINTAIASHNGTNSGVAFSIPINLVKQVIRQLLDKGNVTRGYLGMQLATSFEPADALQLGLDRVQGARVEIVYAGTPAGAAGLRGNDVVLRVDSVMIRNENHLINLISDMPPGKKIRLEIWRDRRTQILEAVVGDWGRAQSRFSPGQ
jgi:serine protease Do